jgi:hypothetical protein
MVEPVMVRQGDVLLVPATRAAITPNHVERARDGGAVVLARGELTGHAHAIRDEGATLFVAEHESDAVLVVEGGAMLVHEEHRPIPLAAGVYLVRRQREYVGDEGHDEDFVVVGD